MHPASENVSEWMLRPTGPSRSRSRLAAGDVARPLQVEADQSLLSFSAPQRMRLSD